MLDRIEFILTEALEALRRNTWMTFAAITTSAVALYLMGVLGLAYLGLNRYLATLPPRLTIDVFLREGLPKAGISSAATKIRAMPDVESATWIPRDEVWQQFRRNNPAAFTEGIDNPLPDKLIVKVKDFRKLESVADTILGLPEVDPKGVSFLSSEQKLLGDAFTMLRVLGIGAGGLMLVTSGVLIFNAIRLSILSRRREIRIMHLVGASHATVALPMLIEGAVQGFFGGVVAYFLLLSTYIALEGFVQGLSAFGRLPALPGFATFSILCILGAAYGGVCSFLALRDRRRLIA